MRDYRTACADFSVEALAADVLNGSLDRNINACVECCDRWADSDRVALSWMSEAQDRQEAVTYRSLREQSAQFAHVLRHHGIQPGDVVAGMLPRIPALLVAILGTWRIGAVYQPLFTAFGPAAIESRVTADGGSGAKLVIVDAANRTKLDNVPDCPPVLVVANGQAMRPGDADFAAELDRQSADFEPVPRQGSDPFILIFTSGTTGKPKGVACPLSALLQFAVYVRDALDVRDEDVLWCFADPGWALGMYATITGPLLLGKRTVLFEGPFSVASTVRVITDLGVTNLMTAPTVYRMLRAADPAIIAPLWGKFRVLSGGGDPLNAELNRWSEEALGAPIHEHYGQTEMGVNVCNHHGLGHPAKVGSIGLPSPGFQMAILDEDLRPVEPGRAGVLAVNRKASPLFFFDGYWQADTPGFRGDWYLTGDTMHQDEDGYFSFVSRNDDLITSAGYRIGPADVEGIIIEHPAVAEVAVIGKPDPERTEVVMAFAVLRAGVAGSAELADELQHLVRHRLSAHAYPRVIRFVPSLPKTPGGKIQRFMLRQIAAREPTT
ncbi:MAG: AMP-binding protein [Rhodospirillales bacterium]|nr:AMP-binding protein [Acetobacter sp.]